MSYDISLYRSEFLKRALEENLGDWTNADPIPQEDLDRALQYLLDSDYVEQNYPWTTKGRCFTHPRSELCISANVYDSSVYFSVDYGENADEALAVAQRDAREVSKMSNLAYYDPQSGEIS